MHTDMPGYQIGILRATNVQVTRLFLRYHYFVQLCAFEVNDCVQDYMTPHETSGVLTAFNFFKYELARRIEIYLEVCSY